jgi:hypothetical protein
MAITVGTDTYISVADATTYISENYFATEDKYIAWAALSAGDKEISLRRACRKIDRQRFQGLKAVSTQALEFPRAIKTDYWLSDYPTLNIYYDSGYVVQSEVPDSVKYAQIEEAVSMVSGTSDRVKLQKEGVTSFSIGNLSESYSSGKSSENYSLVSEEAKELLKVWILRSVPIG